MSYYQDNHDHLHSAAGRMPSLRRRDLGRSGEIWGGCPLPAGERAASAASLGRAARLLLDACAVGGRRRLLHRRGRVLLREEDGSHLLPPLVVRQPVDHVRRQLRRHRRLHRPNHQRLRRANLGRVRRKLPHHRELAVRDLVTEPREGGRLRGELVGALQVGEGDLGAGRGAVRRLEHALQHLLRLGGEEKQQRRLVAARDLREERRAAVVCDDKDGHLGELGAKL
mmetsp:Transcript_4509/g.14620  ORF Transcript_4509/g.14620 Transcript_4509/m.14620 type:complete len:226 (+) Transcript_4509:155-832(+)